MAFKIFRVYAQGLYQPNYQKMAEMKVTTMRKPGFAFMTILNGDQGFGRIEGMVRKAGTPLPNYEVSVYKASLQTLLWTTKTKADGSFKLRNIMKGMECFVVVFPSSEDKVTTNARIKTQIIAE